MSAKNLDNCNRWRNKTVAFRVSAEENEQIDKAVRLTVRSSCKKRNGQAMPQRLKYRAETNKTRSCILSVIQKHWYGS